MIKINIRYCTQFGNYTTKTHTLKKDYSVRELKAVIQELSEIEPSEQSLLIIHNNCKVDLDDETKSVSEYPMQNGSTVYVNRIIDDSQNDKVHLRYFNKLGIIHEESEQFTLSDNDDTQSPSSNQHRNPHMLEPFLQAIRTNQWSHALNYLSNNQFQSVFEPPDSKKAKFEQSEIINNFNPKQFINDIGLDGWNALHYAAFNNYTEIATQLISMKCEINIATRDGWSALQLASHKSHNQIIELLVDRLELDVNYYSHGANAIQIAIKKNNPQAVQLIANHINFNVNTIKAFSTAKCHPNMVKLVDQILAKNNALQNFVEECPERPKNQQGYLNKLNYIPIFMYRRFFVLDTDGGTLTRYKTEQDCPFHPVEVIPLLSISSIQIISDLWYMKQGMYYLAINYTYSMSTSKSIILASHQLQALNRWKDSIQQSMKYAEFMEQKLTSFTRESQLNECVSYVLENHRVSYQQIRSSFEQQEESKDEPVLKLEDLSALEQKSMPAVSFEVPKQPEQKEPDTIQYLKQYKILQMIGQGSFGKVFKVLHKDTNSIYAMKQLSKSRLISKKQIRYAVTECNILKKVDIPNIINLFQSFQTPQFLYLVMDYCPCGDLTLYISKKGKVDERTARWIIKQLITAIEYLHGLNVIYRDLKPENILIAADGKIKLVDFGLSKELGKNNKAKSFCGSPAYLSPEILLGKGATKATDLYGIGAVLYELLSGDPPYYDDALVQLYKNIKNAQLTFPDYFSKESKEVLVGLLQKEASKRVGCRDVNKVNWKEIKEMRWFGEWEKIEEQLDMEGMDDGLEWVNQDTASQNDYTIDVDYQEHNKRVNRVLDWSFSRIQL